MLSILSRMPLNFVPPRLRKKTVVTVQIITHMREKAMRCRRKKAERHKGCVLEFHKCRCSLSRRSTRKRRRSWQRWALSLSMVFAGKACSFASRKHPAFATLASTVHDYEAALLKHDAEPSHRGASSRKCLAASLSFKSP